MDYEKKKVFLSRVLVQKTILEIN